MCKWWQERKQETRVWDQPQDHSSRSLILHSICINQGPAGNEVAFWTRKTAIQQSSRLIRRKEMPLPFRHQFVSFLIFKWDTHPPPDVPFSVVVLSPSSVTNCICCLLIKAGEGFNSISMMMKYIQHQQQVPGTRSMNGNLFNATWSTTLWLIGRFNLCARYKVGRWRDREK